MAQGWLKAAAVTHEPNTTGEPTENEEEVVTNLVLGPEVEIMVRRYSEPGGPGKEKVTE